MHFPFVVFEGLDGSGKSTLMQILSDELKSRRVNHVMTREPGGTPLAEDIRRLLLRTDHEVPVAETELLLYAASRAQHVARVIRPALLRRDWVLCDRFTASSVAFQCFARGLSRPAVDMLNQFAIGDCQPSLNVLLDLTVTASRERQHHRSTDTAPGGDRMEREKSEFHEAVRQGYLAQASAEPATWLVLDATQSPRQMLGTLLEAFKGRAWLV